MAEVVLRHVSKSFGKTQVIYDMDLVVADGEFVVIVGPSGCGKSTVLRMIAGLEPVTGGVIEIGGRVVNDVEPKDRNIAMVFQNYALYPHMSVRENMAYGLRIRGMPKAEIAEHVARAAKILELEGLLDRKPRELSGGQRQRVAMGRAIVRDPAAFLFDEPLSNLDAKLRVQMRLEIQKLSRELGTTSLYVTHDQVEAMTLAHRMVVMNAGRVEQIGAPLDVYLRPASAFVAAFIGVPPMNLLAGRVGEGAFTLGNGLVVRLPAGAPRPPFGAEAILGVRPEHLAPVGEAEAALTLTVETIERLGADTLAHGTFDGNPMVVRLPAEATLQPGTRLALGLVPDEIHWFDPQTQKRLDLPGG
ncbi:MAG: sn-glycerol-3-phosphate import ATP-binding protein UgpC [Burkholderiales bacterium]|nr:sn-glycerol-3-phosphate import ATP-binding protein UgpC [Burkholderiales bacterium]